MHLETVAVYAEHPIKTYGIKVAEGYVLLRCACLEDALAGGLQGAARCGQLGQVVFSTTCCHQGHWQLCALLQADTAEATLHSLRGQGLDSQCLQPVSLIHLQGPHFGDRYGVLAAALKGLEAAGVEPLAMQACMHSIFVVVEPERAADAVRGLQEQFCSPG